MRLIALLTLSLTATLLLHGLGLNEASAQISTPNKPPLLVYPNPQSMLLGGTLTVKPKYGLSDNGTVASVSVFNFFPQEFSGDVTVDATGKVTISNVTTTGTFTIAIQATDTQGATTLARIRLRVSTVPCTNYNATPATPFQTSTIGLTSEISAGDFNNDNKVDLVILENQVQGLTIMLGDGQGGFTETGFVSVENSIPQNAIPADFNRDGNLDLAIITGDGFAILQGDGIGNLAVTTDVSIPLAEIWDLAAGDFNNDGRLDLAFTQRYNDQRLHIYLNNALLGFIPAPGSPKSLVNEPFEIESRDFNNDGNLDLAVQIESNVFTYLGDGTGGFYLNLQLQFPIGPLHSVQMTADDFNKDGNEDLAITTYDFGQGTTFEVRLGAGNGTFSQSQLAAGGDAPVDLISADFNLDGNRDLVHGSIHAISLRSLQNDGAGTFSAVFHGPQTATASQRDTTADFNNDGEADFASINTTGSIYVMLHGGCAPTLTASTNIEVSRCGPPVPKVLGTFVDDDYSPQQMTIEVTSTLPVGMTISNLTATGGKQIVGLVDASPNSYLGTHGIYLRITNPEGQYGFGTVTFNIVDGVQPLSLSQPQNISVFNDPDQCGAIVNYITPQASGGCTPVSTVCAPLSGSLFQKGTTSVSCTAVDQAGNQATKTFSVTVIDNQAPKFNGISDIVVNAAPGQCSTVANFNVTASDNCSAVPVTTNPPSGSVFPAGTTVVTATAIDAAGNGSTATFNVTVNGSGPATITTPVASPAVLGPPNHKMRNVTIDYTVTPGCGGPVTCALSVTSNEPVNGPDDGDAAPDWEVVDPHKVRLRAERSGSGTGRIYTITITCTDAAGYQTTRTATVSVPLDN